MDLPSPPDLLTLLRVSFTYTVDFIIGTIKALRTPTIFTLIIGIILSVLINLHTSVQSFSRFSHAVVGLMIISLVTFVLIACCIAPSVYVQHVYPEARVLITARMVMVLAIVFMGWIIGQAITKSTRANWWRHWIIILGLYLLLCLVSLYPLRASGLLYKDLPSYQKWSQFWDDRDREIREEREQGKSEIEVMAIDHIIPRVGELTPDPDYWYNRCAAVYYRVGSISAHLSGWDD